MRSRYEKIMRAAGHKAGSQWTEEGLWTKAEDAVIRRFMWDRPSWAKVGAMIGRTHAACPLGRGRFDGGCRDETLFLWPAYGAPVPRLRRRVHRQRGPKS